MKKEEQAFRETSKRKVPVTTRVYNPILIKDINRVGTFIYKGEEPEFKEPEKEVVYVEWTNWKEQDQLLVEYIAK